MDWFTLTILSCLALSISTLLDKHLMNKNCDPLGICTFKWFFNGAILFIIGLLFFQPNYKFLAPAILGVLYAIMGILYFNALKLKDIQVVAPFQASTSLFVFLGALVFFHESATFLNFIGVLLIIAGVYLVLLDGCKIPKLDKAFFLILLIIFFSTIYSLLAKKFVADIKPIDLAAVMYLSSAVVLFAYAATKKFKSLKLKGNFRAIWPSLFGCVGTLLLFIALTKGDASKIYPIAEVRSVFIFFLASLFLREKFKFSRLAGTIAVFIGIYLVI